MSEFLQFTSCPYSLHVSGTQSPHLHKIDKSSTTTRSKSRNALISSVFEKWKSLICHISPSMPLHEESVSLEQLSRKEICHHRGHVCLTPYLLVIDSDHIFP